MTDRYITYKGGYKYQLKADYHITTDVTPKVDFDNPDHYLKIDMQGNLTVYKGYAWDGPSGPTCDTKRNMRASLVHDAFYQLLRNEIIDAAYRDRTDRIFEELCIEDGMMAWVARIYYWGLKKFGNPASDPANKRPIQYAPKKV